MRRLAVSFLLFATLLFGADFWDHKLFTQWNADEVERILNNSPWAQWVEVQSASMAMRSGSMRAAQMGAAPVTPESVRGRGVESDMGNRSQGIRGRGPNAGSLKPTPSIRIRFRWVSALPIRQAIAKQRFGDEAASSAEAARMIVQKPEHYILGITGLPRRYFGGLKERVQLRVKGSRPVEPLQVVGQQSAEEDEYYVFFGKAKDGGRDLTAEDGSVEIVLKLDEATLRRRFKLGDMVYYDRLQI